MKRFTLMLMVAFIAVVTMAAGPTKNMMSVQLKTNAIENSTKQVVPTKKFTSYVNVPVSQKLAFLKSKSNANTKLTRRTGVKDVIEKNNMLLSSNYKYDQEQGKLVVAAIKESGRSISISVLDEETFTIGSFINGATNAIQAKFTETNDPELTAYGITATFTISNGQTLLESDYGPVLLKNAEEDAPIKGYIYSDGTILFATYWFTVLGGDGQYAGYMWTNYICSSETVVANGEMTWGEKSAIVYIDQDEEAPKYVTVYNFGNYETAVDIEISYEGTFVIPSQLIGSASNGDFYTYGLPEDESNLIALTGTVNRASLEFDCKWTCYASTGYWYGVQKPASITFTDGTKFTIPEAPQDIAAMPANPMITSMQNTQYGWRINFTIPIVDTEGNEMIPSKLYYEIFTDIAGVIAPLTFTPATHSKLTEDLTIIPYGFTENYDIYESRIYLNDLFSDSWDKIGIKSIYTGGGETNETEIQWFDAKAVTGISAVKSEKTDNGAIYNLSGQRVAEGYKGLVIKNGKKYVVK